MEASEQPAISQAQAKKSSARNLILRGISATGALGLIYLCLRWDSVNGSGWAYATLVALFGLLCLREFYRLAIACGVFPFKYLGYALGPMWVLALEWDLSGASHLAGGRAAWLVFLLLCVGSMVLQLTRKSNDTALTNVSLTVFGIVYCCMLPGLTVHLRHLQLSPNGWPMHGIEFVVVCVFVSKVSDVGALLTGSRWGKHKLIPRLSPGKTWEGALGGLLFSVALLQLMAYTAPFMALNQLGKLRLVFLAVLLAAAALAGDLAESAFKRNSHRKDAGTGVPGFGGILDLTDSLMIASPIMYFFLVAHGAQYVKL